MNPLNSDYAVSLMVQANIEYDGNEPYKTMLELEKWRKNTTGSYFTASEKKSMNELTIIRCTYQNAPCNSSDFTYIFHPYYLSCYQFNSGYDSNGNTVELSHANVDGTDNSLYLELYAGLPNTLASQTTQRGFHIFINNNTVYPFSKAPSPLSVVSILINLFKFLR
jgi:hypothetical protein